MCVCVRARARARACVRACVCVCLHLVIHELEGEGRLPHPTAPHHNHFVEGQGVLALGLRGGHGSAHPALGSRGQEVSSSSGQEVCRTTGRGWGEGASEIDQILQLQ